MVARGCPRPRLVSTLQIKFKGKLLIVPAGIAGITGIAGMTAIGGIPGIAGIADIGLPGLRELQGLLRIPALLGFNTVVANC